MAAYRSRGKWNITLSVKNPGDIPVLAEASGTATGEWVLNGYFLRQTYMLVGKGPVRRIDGTITMAYDPAKKVYRRWEFTSNGHMAESRGTWDAESRTMTWTYADAECGVSVVRKVKFTEDDAEGWSEEIKVGGRLISESFGKSIRQKGAGERRDEDRPPTPTDPARPANRVPAEPPAKEVA